MTKEQFDLEMERIGAIDWSITRTAISQATLCMRYIESLEAENAALTLLHTQAMDEMLKMQNRVHKLEAEIAQLKKDKLEFNAQCFHKDETISVLKNRITELEEIIDRIYDISMKKDHEFGLTYQYANDIIKQKAEIDMLKQENAKLRAEIAQLKAQEEEQNEKIQ